MWPRRMKVSSSNTKKGSQVLLFLYHHEEFSSFSLHLWEKEAAAARSNNLLFRGHVPSIYMNVGHFSEYSGHPNNNFQTF